VSTLNYFWLNSCSLDIHERGSLIVLFVVQHFLMFEAFATTILLLLLLYFASEVQASKYSQSRGDMQLLLLGYQTYP
jgi:hypothetical protein